MLRFITFLFTLPIKIYQWVISPLLPNACRHTPTCSSYTIEAIQEWGPIKGIWMGIRRLSRCHPWGTSGYDPVPKQNKSFDK
jgi:putative membrane protein insertion efficiency factor